MKTIIKSYQDDPYVQSKRWTILIVLNLFTFMSTLDASIVNIALPVISEKMSLPESQIQWAVTGYLIAICTFILFFGKLGDMYGKIKIFKMGSVIFLIGSVLCGLSTNLTMLILFRVVQAIGSSMLMANSPGIITDIFPAKERGKAMGFIGTFVSLGSIAGPSLGGVLLSFLGWQSIFLVNLPIGLIAIAIGWKLLPDDIRFYKGKFDISGSLLFSIFIVALFSGLLLSQQFGFQNNWILFALALAIVSAVLFFWVEVKTPEPMLQLSLFKNKLFSLSILSGFLVFVATFCFNIIAPFYTQNILGMSPAHAGLLLMLFPVTMAIVAPLSGALSDKIGSELLTFLGLLVMVVAQLGLALLRIDSSAILVGALVAMLGIGNGLFQSPNNSLIMSTVPKAHLGIAGSVNSLIRNVGMVVGISLATTTLFSVMSHKAGFRVTGLVSNRPDLFITGMQVVFICAATICVVAALLTGWRLLKARLIISKNKSLSQ